MIETKKGENGVCLTGDDLVDDDLGPDGVVGQIDEEPVAERHEEQAEPDGLPEQTRLLDKDARCG